MSGQGTRDGVVNRHDKTVHGSSRVPRQLSILARRPRVAYDRGPRFGRSKPFDVTIITFERRTFPAAVRTASSPRVEVLHRMKIPSIGLFDRRDERLARQLRDRLGRRGRLVSWHCDEPSTSSPRWTARISCRELSETLECNGQSRCRAILAAVLALDRRLPP